MAKKSEQKEGVEITDDFFFDRSMLDPDEFVQVRGVMTHKSAVDVMKAVALAMLDVAVDPGKQDPSGNPKAVVGRFYNNSNFPVIIDSLEITHNRKRKVLDSHFIDKAVQPGRNGLVTQAELEEAKKSG